MIECTSVDVPPQIIQFVEENRGNKINLNSHVCHVKNKQWNNYSIYIKYIDAKPNQMLGLPMFILYDGDKYIRFANGCERDMIMSDDRIKC